MPSVCFTFELHQPYRLSTYRFFDIGVKDDYRMQRVKAFVLLKPDAPSPTEAETILREYCSHHIARYACPREFEFRDELPLTAIGKVHYRQLESE